MKLIEGFIDSLRDYYIEHLPARLQMLETEYDDGITLPEPAAYYRGEMSLTTIPSWPVVFLLGRSTTIERYNSNFVDATHRVDIGVMLMEQDSERLQLRLYRYIRAIWELIVERYFSFEDYSTTSMPTINFSPTIAREENGPYISDAVITIQVNQQEEDTNG